MSNATATPPAPAKKAKGPQQMYKYRVKSGSYWMPTPIIDEETGEPVRNPDGSIKTKDVPCGPGRPGGDIITVPFRMEKFNVQGHPPQFELLGADNDPRAGQLEEATRRATAAEARVLKMVDALDAGALIDFATKEGIDRKGETNRDKVRAIILSAWGIDPRMKAD